MAKRVSTIHANDLVVLTRFMGVAQEQMMRYAPHAQYGSLGEGYIYGDQNVCIALITLRDKINSVIEASKKAGN